MNIAFYNGTPLWLPSWVVVLLAAWLITRILK